MEQDETISEGAEYSSKSEFSKPKLVEEAIRKCVEARSKEMRSGYYNYKFDKSTDSYVKIWIQDTRKIFDAHIKAVRNLLSPEIKADSIYLSKEKKIKEEMKNIFNKHCYTIRFLENHIWKFTDQKVIPEHDEEVICNLTNGSNTADKIKGGWNLHTTIYWDEITIGNDIMFGMLNDLVSRINYFKQKVNY